MNAIRNRWTVFGALLVAALTGCTEPTPRPETAPPQSAAARKPVDASGPASSDGSVTEMVLIESEPADSQPDSAPSSAQSSAPSSKPTPAPAPRPTPAPTVSEKPAPSPAPSDKPKRAEYAPHVTIDWTVPQVEIAAKVVLREGPLELLLCSQGTKEHESILATPARPRHVFEALGLIGATPGRPPAFDLDRKLPIPATGQRLAIELITEESGGRRVVAAHEWMKSTAADRPLAVPRWVFCGSRTEGDRFAADGEGTMVCVVDFDTAVVGTGENHSADNDALWAAADSSAIPATGTPCIVVIRPLDDAPINLVLTPENMFQWDDRVLDALELDTLIRERTRHNPDQKVTLGETPGEPNPFARLAAHAIVGSGIKRENLTLNLLPRPEKPATPPAPPPAESSPAEDPEAPENPSADDE